MARTLYLCANVRRPQLASCGRRHNTRKVASALVRLLKRKRAYLEEDVTVVRSGCLGRCPFGPVLLVHPGGVFYRYQTPNDLDEIVTEHLLGGRPVERLRVTEDESHADG